MSDVYHRPAARIVDKMDRLPLEAKARIANASEGDDPRSLARVDKSWSKLAQPAIWRTLVLEGHWVSDTGTFDVVLTALTALVDAMSADLSTEHCRLPHVRHTQATSQAT